MATVKKLDTFSVLDKYALDETTINQEAQASAIRRAEVMGWSEVFVRRTSAAPAKQNEYMAYEFELWGKESEQTGTNQDTSDRSSLREASDFAAKDM